MSQPTDADHPEVTINRSLDTAGQTIPRVAVGDSATSRRYLASVHHADGAQGGNGSNSAAFRLLRAVAVGGSGEVWEAEQLSLRRVIAVKIIRQSQRQAAEDNPALKQALQDDFRVEAMTTARLEHPNIVPVHDIGVDESGWPMMAMKLVRGESWEYALNNDLQMLQLDDYLAKHLPIFLAMMQAVAFAHARGIIHRDLKPSQVMLGEFGEVLLMDWGLAMAGSGAEAQDRHMNAVRFEWLPDGAIASSPGGTPAYMAPEQVLKSADQVSFATDIYLLGGTLFKILTGRAPRRGETRHECLKLAATGEVMTLAEAAGERFVPPELGRLALRALSLRPEDRIPTVHDFIVGVKNYLSGATDRGTAEALVRGAAGRFSAIEHDVESGIAQPGLYAECSACLSDLDRARGLWPRNPEIGALRDRVLWRYANVALQGGDLMLARGLAGIAEDRVRGAALEAQIAVREAAFERQRRQRKHMSVALVVLLLALLSGSMLYLRAERQAARLVTEERDMANSARHTAESANQKIRRLQRIAETEQYFANIETAATSLQRELLQKADNHLFDKTPPELRQWEWGDLVARAHPEKFTIRAYDSATYAVFSHDDSQIIGCNRDGLVNIWDAKKGVFLRSIPTMKGRITSVSSSPMGDRFLFVSPDNDGAVIARASGEWVLHLKGGAGLRDLGAWSPRGDLVATGGVAPEVRIWNPDTGALVTAIKVAGKGIRTLSFSRDGQQIATGDFLGGATVWDAKSGVRIMSLPGHSGVVRSIRYSVNGAMIATACDDENVRVFDASTGALTQTIALPHGDPVSVVFIEGDRMLAIQAEKGTISLIELGSGDQLASVIGSSPGLQLSMSSDGKDLLASSRAQAAVYSIKDLLKKPVKIDVPPADPAFNAFDQLIPVFGLTAGREPTWRQRERIWNTASGRTFFELSDRRVAFQSRYSSFSNDAKWRFDVDPETQVGVIRNSASGKVVYQHPAPKIVTALFSPDGQSLAVIESFDKICLLDVGTWQTRRVLQRDQRRHETPSLEIYIPAWAAFTPDSQSLIVPYLNGRIVRWNLQDGVILWETPQTRGIGLGIQLNKDGSQFLIPGNDQRITLWEAATGEMLREFNGHSFWIYGASFSPDGSRVVSFSRDHTARIWETETGREILTILECPQEREFVAACFSPDGASLVVALDDGTVQELKAVPWRPEDYFPEVQGLTEIERFELYKRRKNIDPSIQPEDVTTTPAKSQL